MGNVYSIEEETLVGIADAIREKKGTSDMIPTTTMENEIRNLPSGGFNGVIYASAPTTDIEIQKVDTSALSTMNESEV